MKQKNNHTVKGYNNSWSVHQSCCAVHQTDFTSQMVCRKKLLLSLPTLGLEAALAPERETVQ